MKKLAFSKVHFRPQHILVLTFLFILSCSKDEPMEIDEEEPNSGPVVYPPYTLPVVSVDTYNQEIPDEPKIPGIMQVSDRGNELFQGPIGIERRGQSSQSFPKKQYGVETKDASNQDLDVSILDMPLEEDWILYAPYSDKSLMRNVLAYDIARSMGRYASRTQFVNMKLNGLNQGIYVFMEKLKRDVNRINIDRLKPDENDGENLTGGYILKIDKGPDNDPQTHFVSSYTDVPGSSIRFFYDTPDYDEITAAQKEYIENYMYDFETALQSENFANPETGYRAYIDVESFVDFLIVNEVSNNVDAYRISTWVTKDKNSKLSMGPVWDFNLGFGNANYCGGGQTDVWSFEFNQRSAGDFWNVPFWWEKLMSDPYFRTQLKNRWESLRSGALSTGQLMGTIDSYYDTLNNLENAERNFQRWPILGEWVWPNQFVGSTYEEEVNYLKDWLNQRLTWMDAQISQF